MLPISLDDLLVTSTLHVECYYYSCICFSLIVLFVLSLYHFLVLSHSLPHSTNFSSPFLSQRQHSWRIAKRPGVGYYAPRLHLPVLRGGHIHVLEL
ncbi:hypothetical protein BDQ12DRAFT_674223, partial [Crucibulum laeve]